jgi:signal transduction histidine kinase
LLTVWYYIKRTENIQKERIRRLNDEKEKELYDSKINFFTNIAHEIRTPLSLIIGPLEYLIEKTDSDDIYREYLGIIEQNYKRLHALVTQLLDFRKVDADAYKLSYDSYNVKDAINKVIRIFELSVLQKKVTIDISSIPEEMMIVTDEEAFIKIISNLLSNALKWIWK